MNKQLQLLDSAGAWRLDDETREIGRRGIEDARKALRDSRPRYAVPTSAAA